LWRDGNKKDEAAEELKLTSRDLLSFGLIDEVVEEPLGGAHRDLRQMGENLKAALIRNLDALADIPPETLAAGRYDKFRRYGEFIEGAVLEDYLPREEPAPSAEVKPAEPGAESAPEAAPAADQQVPDADGSFEAMEEPKGE
jgi:acetyl-CoA carboxylase carboxyl transferase subunit alpha